MTRALYITHPEVVIDPAVSMPQWGLSETGMARAGAFAQRNVLPADVVFFTSDERKTKDLATILAAPTEARIVIDAAFNENDRRATGFLQADEFAATFDRFFANPETSPDGWETAIDTQSRIIAATRRTMADLPEGTLAVFCGHGTIGTLLKCHCGGRPIARHEEQRVMAHPGGGNAFVFDIAQPALYCDWVAMEDFDPALLG